MCPHRSAARSTIRCGASSSVRSTASVAMRSPPPAPRSSPPSPSPSRSPSLIACSKPASLLSSRPVPTIAMPMAASLVAHPKPIPLLAPVTIATCMSRIHLRQRRPDLMLQHLAGVVLRQRAPDLHSLGDFELGDPMAHQQLAEAGQVWRRQIGSHDDSAGAFAGALVGNADDSDLRDARVAHQDVLDLLRRDVLSVADDDVLGSAGDHHILAVDPTAQIPRAEESLGVK